MKRIIIYTFLFLVVLLGNLQAQKYDDIFDVFEQENVKVYVRAEKRVLKFAPDQDIYSIIKSIKEKFKDNSFLEKEIKKGGLELYINKDILSQVEITKSKIIKLQKYLLNIDIGTMSEIDIKELLKYLDNFVTETKQIKKETYKKKALAKALQMKLSQEGINIDFSKITIVPIDISKIIKETKLEVEQEKQDPSSIAKKQLVEDFTLEDFYHIYKGQAKSKIYTEYMKYHFKKIFRSSKENLNFSSIYVKPTRRNATKNLLLKSPGALGSLIGSSLELASNPFAAFLTGTFSMALNVFHSIYATTVMNFHDRLANWNKVGQVVFEFLYGRAIEMVVYRLPLYLTQNIKFFDSALGLKVILNSTLGAWLGATGYKGWNRLVQKGIVTREQAGTMQETAMNAFLFSQLSTGFSGDPFWDAAYLISFGLSQAIDMGVWFFSQIKNAKTKIVMISLGKEIESLESSSLEKFKQKLKQSFAQDHGFVLSQSREDLFLKVPRLRQNQVKTKNMFLEYNILLSEKYTNKAIEVLRAGGSLRETIIKVPMQSFGNSENYDNPLNLMTLEDILFKEKTGLASRLYQNIQEITRMNFKTSFSAKGLGVLSDLMNANQFNILNRHSDLYQTNSSIVQEFDALTFKYIDLTEKIISASILYKESKDFITLQVGYNKTIDDIRKKKIEDLKNVLIRSIYVNMPPCETNIGILQNMFAI